MRPFLSCPGRAAQDSHEFVHIVGPSVGKLALQVTPDPFVRVQFRCVTGEVLAVQSGVAREELTNLLAPMDGPRVPEKDNRAAEMTKEETEKDSNLRLADVAGMEMDIQPWALALWTDGHRGNRRDLVALVAMADHRRLSPGCPRATHVRNQKKAAFV